MMRPMKHLAPAVAVSLLLLAASVSVADVDLTPEVPEGITPPSLFSDGMVLQRDAVDPVFGRAIPGEQVTVTFNGQEKTTTAGPDGKWRVDLDPMSAGGPFVMTIQGNNTITISDVRIGEVWVCAGQSNMTRLRVRRTTLELNPNIRTLVRKNWNDQPGINAYKFASNVYEALGVPVGILNLASGGTEAVLWIGDTATTDPDPEVAQYLIGNWGYVYRKFVKPMQPYRIRGVIWWQGEADAHRPINHRTLYPVIIRSWRAEWGIGDFPWISMQVPTGRGLQEDGVVTVLPDNPSATDQAAYIRQTYVRALAEFPYTSFASTLDLEGGIHPRDTTAFSDRLTVQAFALVYGEPLIYAGPMYSSMDIEGQAARIHYRQLTNIGLQARDGGAIKGFALSSDGITWHWADATVDGNDILLTSPDVPNPAYARYAWGNRPTWANLINFSGYAASAFSSEVTPGEYGP
jgi:sialate O-acetylesterase